MKLQASVFGEEPELNVELSDLQDLTYAILAKYGYDFTNYAMSSFKRRILFVMKKRGFQEIGQLKKAILKDPSFFEQFIVDITVNTTELFRDPSFWVALREQVLPVLNEKPEFNIWHAACSSGEEVISMAILLEESGMREKANIYATDINMVVLQQAQQARYPKRYIDQFEENYKAVNPHGDLSRYYSPVKGTDLIQFSPTLIEKVRFKHHDLVVDKPFFKFDLILCRNVMIYFNQKLQDAVLDLLHASLFLGGFLAIGTKESLIWCKSADKFEEVNAHERIYRKIKL